MGHVASGRNCVVSVGDTDTVLDLKGRALEELFAGSHTDTGMEARRVAARIPGG